MQYEIFKCVVGIRVDYAKYVVAVGAAIKHIRVASAMQ